MYCIHTIQHTEKSFIQFLYWHFLLKHFIRFYVICKLLVSQHCDIKWCSIYAVNLLTLKRVGGAHSAPPSTFTLFVTKITNRTDSNSNCKFINIRCGRFDTILRSIWYSVKFWRPSGRIGRQNLIFPKIKPTNLFSLKTFFRILDQEKKYLANRRDSFVIIDKKN